MANMEKSVFLKRASCLPANNCKISKRMKNVDIFTDGSCHGNPGPGGWAAILSLSGTQHRREISGGFRHTTNNRMELMAAIMALSALKEPCAVLLHSDSQYLCNALQKGWIWNWKRRGWKKKNNDPVPNSDLCMRLLALLKVHQLEFIWLRGHAGHPENERCDELARTCASRPDLPIDENYENSP